MSTKTSFKRIALVAVAALGFGVLSVVPSNADQTLSSISIVSQDSTGTTNTAVSATVAYSFSASGDKKGMIGALFYAAPATSSLNQASLDWTTVTDTTTVSTNANGICFDEQLSGSWGKYTYVCQVIATDSGRTSSQMKIGFTPDKAGTYQVRLFGFPQGTTDAIFVDWNIVVTDPTPTVSSSTGYVRASDKTSAADFTAALDDTGYLSASKTAGILAGTVYVKQSNGSTTNPLVENNASKLTASISGSGLISIVPLADACVATAGVRAQTTTTKLIGNKVCIFSDGTAGTGTVTWSAGTTVLGSTTATFYGSPASYTAVVSRSVINKINKSAAQSYSPTLPTDANYRAVYVVVKDSNGNIVPGADVYMNSSDTTIIDGVYQKATSGSTGKAYFTLTGVATGTAKLSFTSARFANDPLITTSSPAITTGPVDVRVGINVPAAVKVAFDKSEYLPGEKASVTVTLTDSKGNPVPRGVYSIFDKALSSNLALSSGTLPGTADSTGSCMDANGIPEAAAATCANYKVNPVLTAGQVWVPGNDGVATFAANMPVVSGTVSFTGTVYSYLTNDLGASAVIAGTAVSASATVAVDNSVAQAAADAAAEATDAANAATDAANAAAEAADAATAAAQDAADAVAALSTQVSEMIDALKKQITALTNLVIKIQKKVKA